jgi:chorismate mutase
MKSIRGAIAVVENREERIIDASKRLILEILDKNNLIEDDIVSALFTVTNDLNAAFPAKAFRELNMTSISALDALAPDITNDLSGCIRVQILVSKDLNKINHIYLDEAKKLRSDR